MAKLNFKKGQSLIELLIALGVGTTIILATITVLSLILRIGQQDASFQSASFLGQQLSDNLESAAERDWRQISLAVEGADYRLATSTESGNLILQQGVANTLVDGISYSSFFHLNSVNRDANGNISPGGINDPSTKKAEIFISWLYRGETVTLTITKYIIRRNNRSIVQSDWSRGPTTPSDLTTSTTTSRFFQSDSVDFSSQPGSIRLKSQ